MLLGQSIFQSVLTRLDEERGDDSDEEAGESFRIKGLSSGFAATTAEDVDTGASGADAYRAFLQDEPDQPGEQPPVAEMPPEPPPPPVMPAHLLRLSEEEIAEELAITAADTEATLADKRRRFAKANHPDGVSVEFRDNANSRMQIANLLIDRAIKQLAWR